MTFPYSWNWRVEVCYGNTAAASGFGAHLRYALGGRCRPADRLPTTRSVLLGMVQATAHPLDDQVTLEGSEHGQHAGEGATGGEPPRAPAAVRLPARWSAAASLQIPAVRRTSVAPMTIIVRYRMRCY